MNPEQRVDMAVHAVLGLYTPFGESPRERRKMAAIWLKDGLPQEAVRRIRRLSR